MHKPRPARSPYPDRMEGEGIERVIRLARLQASAEAHAAHRYGVEPADCPHCSLAPALRKLHGVAAITTVMDAACDARQQGRELRVLDENLMRGLLLACDELGDAAECELLALCPESYVRGHRPRPC